MVTSKTSHELFRLLRNQLPINAPSACFQFALGNKKIRITNVPLAMYDIEKDVRLVLEFVNGKAMVQVNVEIEGGEEMVNLWVRKDSTVKSLRELMQKRIRLPSDKMRLSVNYKEVEDSSTVGSISHSHTLSLQLSTTEAAPSTPSRLGLSLVARCDNPSCSTYLQPDSIPLGFGRFEYPSLTERAKCNSCLTPCSVIEQLKFRTCEVYYDGTDDHGSDLSGSEVFEFASGELLKGKRVSWRRLFIDGSPLTPESLSPIS